MYLPSSQPRQSNQHLCTEHQQKQKLPLSVSEDVWKEEGEETERGKGEEKSSSREGLFFCFSKGCHEGYLFGAGTIAIGKGNRKMYL